MKKFAILVFILLVSCAQDKSVTPENTLPSMFDVRFFMGTNFTDPRITLVFNMTHWPKDTTEAILRDHIEFHGYHTATYTVGEGKLVYVLNPIFESGTYQPDSLLNKWIKLDLFLNEKLTDSLADTKHTIFDDLIVSNTVILSE